MKKLLIGFALMFLLMPAVNAETVETGSGVTETPEEETDAGITPDSIFYFFDIALENLDLALTFDEEAKVEKFIAYAEERLAEAEEMNDEEKQEFVEELILEYLANIEEASDGLVGLDDEVAEELEGILDEAIAESDEIAGELPEDLYNKLEANKGAAYIKFSLVREAIGSTDEDVVGIANAAGLGLGELAQIAAGAEMLEQDFVETLNAVIEIGSVEEYFAQFDLKVSDLLSKGVAMKQAKIQERLDKAIDKGNDKQVASAERQMSNAIAVEEMKEAFDEIKTHRDSVLEEYGVEDMDQLPDDVKDALQDELKEARQTAIEERKETIQEKQEEMKEAVQERKDAREKQNSDAGENGKSEDKSKGKK